MGTVIPFKRTRFDIGDIVCHRLFDYRGVIVDVDTHFELSDLWYEQIARSRPPKNKPWYHVLVDGATHTTYVAERNLLIDENPAPIAHPMLTHFFSHLENGRYVR